MKPSNFSGTYPWDSIIQACDAETVAQNIMKILKRTGDEWRVLTFEEYRNERLKDGGIGWNEQFYFDKVICYCTEYTVAGFSPEWLKIVEREREVKDD